MNKISNFSGQPIFSQLLKLISKAEVIRIANKMGTDRYYKVFKTYDHLVSMLFCIFNQCNSLREVVTGLMASHGKLNHLGLQSYPARSTFSDGNKKRSYKVFEAIYQSLHKRYIKNLPDSRCPEWKEKLYIIDSTTISLFQEILKNAGRPNISGKRKGGIKAHTMIKSSDDLPLYVRFTSAAAHDVGFLKEVNLPPESIAVFDKAYVDYKIYEKWTKLKIWFVSRLKASTVYKVLENRKINYSEYNQGVSSDQIIELGHRHNDKITRTKVRLIRFYDKEKNRHFEFITNNMQFTAYHVSLIYKQRWQIEKLFKRIKQNYPLKYFLGDNPNAIQIQIWCSLIADLLVQLIKKQLRRKWAYSNIVSTIRIHLLTYIDIKKFLNNPEKSLKMIYIRRSLYPDLFSSQGVLF
jgi:hypothetical protein